MTDQVFEPLINVEQAAALLRLHPKTVQAMARKGQLPCARMGKYWMFRASLLNDWIHKQMTKK